MWANGRTYYTAWGPGKNPQSAQPKKHTNACEFLDRKARRGDHLAWGEPHNHAWRGGAYKELAGAEARG
jgi:hypothetical protein